MDNNETKEKIDTQQYSFLLQKIRNRVNKEIGNEIPSVDLSKSNVKKPFNHSLIKSLFDSNEETRDITEIRKQI